MTKRNRLLYGILVFAICVFFCSPMNVSADDEVDEWYGNLSTTSGADVFYGTKRTIEFVLPTPRAFNVRDNNDIEIINVKITKSGKKYLSEDVVINYDEWDKQEAVRKFTVTGAGTYKIKVGDKSFKFKLKKASSINSYTPKPDITIVEKNSKKCISIKGLDVGIKAKIYRCTDPINGNVKLIKTTSKGEYIDTDVKEGKSYFYQVCFIAKDGKKTFKSKKNTLQGWKIS